MSVEILIRADSYCHRNASSDSVSQSSEQIVDSVEIIDDSYEIWKKSKLKLVLNLIVLSVACLLVHTAFLARANSSKKILNIYLVDEVLAFFNVTAAAGVSDQRQPTTTTHAIAIAAEVLNKLIDCFLVPQYLIFNFGTKPTLLVSFLSYLVFFLTNKFYLFNLASYLGIFLNQRKPI
jgi:hypothetical protein